VARLKSLGVVVFGAGLLVAGLRAQETMPWQSGGDKTAPAVRYEYPEQVAIAAGKPAIIELHFRVRDGLHINSHVPLEKSLIRTELIAIEPPGVKISAVDFPAGVPYALASLPNEKLSVYTGDVVLRAHVTAQAGEHLLQAALRYQACDRNSCYPPKKAPVAVDIIAR
jgi:hypothetical protein